MPEARYRTLRIGDRVSRMGCSRVMLVVDFEADQKLVTVSYAKQNTVAEAIMHRSTLVRLA